MMNKFTVFALVCVFALGACLPAPAPTTPAPTVDIVGTVDSIAKTAVAQTLTAQPSPTTVPVLDTPTPPIADASATSTPIINTDTPQPNLTTTPATATSGTEIPGITPTIVLGSPTLTPTLGVLTYGTLPPANNPFIDIAIVNKSKSQAYISLQVLTDQGYTIIEYPVKGTINILIPTGWYTYVAWVGGRQIIGSFQAKRADELIITIYKDKITINK